MPRAFLKTKNRGGHKVYTCTICGEEIKPGEDYYTWKFNRGSRYFQHASHGHPKRSQLSNSKMAEVWDAVDSFDVSDAASVEDIKTALEDVASAADNVAQEYVESADNIEQAFPSGNTTSEACRGTADELESWASTLRDWEPDDDEPPEGETEEDWLESCRHAAQELVDEAPEYQG